MALRYSSLVIFAMVSVKINQIISEGDTTATLSPLDPKRRNDIVNDAFLEQKDLLLDMLETKLKEVRDRKKKEDDRNPSISTVDCDLLPKDINIKLQGNGIIAVGDADVKLKYGENGKNKVILNATGISNIGRAHVELGVADGAIQIPGLENLFNGQVFVKGPCQKREMVNATLNNDKDVLTENTLSPRRNANNQSLVNNNITEDFKKITNIENITEIVPQPSNSSTIAHNYEVNETSPK